ncbi:MAG: asparagine synthase-related protein, partial [Candidatus Acidiferrales bacterium]
PAELEGRYWMTADARLDARAELLARLALKDREVDRHAPDSRLILEAYAAWGRECVQHLRGDFAFAVWDAKEKILFCARDRFGVRLFYYTELEQRFLFSNTLNCLRGFPGVSSALDDAAIGDFLLFGQNYNPATTTFRDIRRLPAAHTLTVSREEERLERYWTAPVNGRLRYKNPRDYVEHFQLLLHAAVADRLRTERCGILLSGGLDSGAIAATARDLSGTSAGAAHLRAYTIIYQTLVPDEEGPLALQTAAHLGIPQQQLALDDVGLFERWDEAGSHWPEPVNDPLFAGVLAEFQTIAAHSRVVLDGEGSDNLMHFQIGPYATDLLRRGELGRFLTEVPRYVRQRPSYWPGIRRRAGAFFSRDPYEVEFPRWIAPGFAGRLNLEERWRTIELGKAGAAPRKPEDPAHPILPTAHASMLLPQWTRFFELADAGVTRCAVEVRYPFLDLRIVNFLLAVPPYPWLYQKNVLRQAMEGRLPEAIRTRPKTPMARDPLAAQLKRHPTAGLDSLPWSDEMNEFVDRAAVPKFIGGNSEAKAAADVRPACLNFWLQLSRQIGYNHKAEARDG